MHSANVIVPRTATCTSSWSVGLGEGRKCQQTGGQDGGEENDQQGDPPLHPTGAGPGARTVTCGRGGGPAAHRPLVRDGRERGPARRERRFDV